MLTMASSFDRRQRAATEAREAALVSKHATELSHAVGRQRDELRWDTGHLGMGGKLGKCTDRQGLPCREGGRPEGGEKMCAYVCVNVLDDRAGFTCHHKADRVCLISLVTCAVSIAFPQLSPERWGTQLSFVGRAPVFFAPCRSHNLEFGNKEYFGMLDCGLFY